jgi:hypothetical protein
MIYHNEKKFHFWLRPQTSYIWHVVIDAECLIVEVLPDVNTDEIEGAIFMTIFR